MAEGVSPHPPELVSILTPSLNQGRWLEESLRSIRRQDYPRIEQIVVDGGSTDGTLDVLRRYEGPSLRLIVAEASSQTEALNAALAASSGDVIGWLNTDDAFFGVDAVSSAVRTLRQHPEAVAVYGDAVIVDEDSRIVRHTAADARLLRFIEPFVPIVQPAVFMRRSALEDRFLRTDLNWRLDHELWLYLAERGRLVKIDRILAIDRDHAHRKVRVGEEEVMREGRAIAEQYGLRRQAPLVARGRRWFKRLAGVRPLLSLERDYRLAFPAKVGTKRGRIHRQLFMSHGQLSAPFAGKPSRETAA